MYKILILGGGASGVFAAINLAKKIGGEKVQIIEGGERLLKKVAVTGNGQCNLSNIEMRAEHYIGDKELIKNTLESFSVEDTLREFENLGIYTIERKNGRIYPRSLQASSVVDMLRLNLENLGVGVITEAKILEIEKTKKGYLVKTTKGKFQSEYIIYSLGGATYPKLLTKAENFELLKPLGHTSTELLPALVQLVANNCTLKMLKGIKFDVKMTIFSNGKAIKSSQGEIHFAGNALSGPVTFSLSPYASKLLNEGKDVSAKIDFFKEYDSGEFLELLCERAEKLKDMPKSFFLSTMVHNQIGRAILKECNISQNGLVSDFSDNELIKIMKVAKGYEAKITSTNNENFAQVTLGGIKTKEVDEKFQSKYNKKLYIIGEALDVTGDCGGYNLQWAWSTGYIVSDAISIEVSNE